MDSVKMNFGQVILLATFTVSHAFFFDSEYLFNFMEWIVIVLVLTYSSHSIFLRLQFVHRLSPMNSPLKLLDQYQTQHKLFLDFYWNESQILLK